MFNKNILIWILGVFLLIGLVNAETFLYKELTSDTQVGFHDNVPNGIAQQFVANATTVTHLNFTIYQLNGYTGILSFHLYDDSGSNQLGNLLEGYVLDVPLVTIGTSADDYQWQVNLTEVLNVSEKYWFMMNATAGGGGKDVFFRLDTSATPSPSVYNKDTAGTYRNTYALEGTITDNTGDVDNSPQVTINNVTLPDSSVENFVDLVIEYDNGYYDFKINATDDINLSCMFFNVYNSTMVNLFNSSVCGIDSNTTSQNFSVNSSVFVDFNNPFTVNVSVNDSTNQFGYDSVSFNFTDTQDPNCNFSSDTGTLGTNYSFNVLCTDEHFFSLNVSCTNSSYSFFVDGLNTESYLYQGQFNLSDNNTCNYEYCDGHTDKLEDEWAVFVENEKDFDDKLEFYKDSVKVGGFWVDGGEVEYIEAYDRIKFRVTFDNTLLSYQTVYYRPSAGSYFFNDPKYFGWTVSSSSKTWFDLNNDADAKVTFVGEDNGVYEYRIETKEKTVTFSSIGELNCVSGSVIITATSPPTIRTDPFLSKGCPLDYDLNESFGYFMLFLMIGLIFWFNETRLKIPMLGFSVGLGLIFWSVPLYNCSVFVPIVFTMMGIGVILLELQRTAKGVY